MRTIELSVTGRSVSADSLDVELVRTSVGVDQIHARFDSDEWLDFAVEVTFSNGTDSVTQSVVLSSLSDAEGWLAETTVKIPWEVLDENGRVYVTFEGTDSSGNHIITAKGHPLTVVEAGDLRSDTEPTDSPSVTDWQQAYSDAMAVVSQAATLVSELESRLETMVSEAESTAIAAIESYANPATADTLGMVKVGEGLAVTSDGTLTVTSVGLTNAERLQIANVASLAYYCFDTTFDSDGYVESTATVKRSALPIASVTDLGVVKIDGTSITIDSGGLITANYETADTTSY